MVLQKRRSRVIWGMKRFIVTLSPEERAALKRVLSAGTARARTLTRARILLKADQRPDGPGLRDAAVAEAAEAGAPVSRLAWARSLLVNLERELLQATAGEPTHQRWRGRLATLGKQVRVGMGDQVLEGLAEDVDADGSLLLRRRDGSLVTIVAGDVTLQVLA